MEIDAVGSPEVDQLDLPGESSPVGAPVVLVEYRNRGVPLWLFIPLVVIVSLTAIMTYHRLVAVRYRTQAALAIQALETGVDEVQAVVPPVVDSKPAEPLARNSQPIGKGSALLESAPGPISTSHSVSVPGASATSGVAPAAMTAVAEPAVGSVASASKSLVAGRPETGSDSFADAGLLSSATADMNSETAADKAARSRASTILKNPMIKFSEPGKMTAAIDIPERTEPGKNLSNEGKGAVEAKTSPSASTPANGDEPTNAAEGDSAKTDGVDVTAEPLPSKEESLRQIAQEAARKKTEIDDLAENKRAEFHSIRQGERVKFRDELRELLQSFGNNAGAEIDKLAKRNGYDIDRARFLKARQIWKFTRMTVESKVRLTRSLDLPEAAILNFLSDEIHQRVGTREGPRNRNEVRIRAAKMLLNFPLPTTEEMAIPTPSVVPNPGATSTKMPTRATTARGVDPRSR